MKKFFRSLFSVNPSSLTLCNIVLVIILFLIGLPILDLIELKTYDLRFKSRDTLKPSPSVVMAVIDEKSLDREGRWPWPRSKLAHLVDILSRDGAKVIGFDIGFPEPDENSYLKFIAHLDHRIEALGIRDKQLADFLSESKAEADNDVLFADAVRRSNASVVLGYFFHMTEADLNYRIDQEEKNRQLERIDHSKYPLILYEDQGMEIPPFISTYAPEANLAVLVGATKLSGYFNMLPDKDGAARWMPLTIQCGEDVFSPLSIQCAWHFLNRPQLMVKVAVYGEEGMVEGIQMGQRFIPTDEEGRMLINYLGPPKSFPHFSITDILHETLPKETFKDKIVLVGATAVGLYDLRVTPFSPNFPGLEVHATVIDNILENRFLSKPGWTKVYDMFAIIVVGILLGTILPRLNSLKGILFASGLFIILILMSRWLFISSGILFNIVYPLLALSLIYTSLTVFHYLTEERERKKIKGAFSYYVSSSVVNEMLKNPDQLKLGGDKKDLSVLFSDIRGFTTISEGLAPEDLVHLLNEYLTVMTDVVFKYDGTLDKYMGDAIMAIYGAPLNQQDHPSRACHSALEMMEKLNKLNKKWIREGKPPMDIGIGINTDMMMVGNMGSDQRFDYTVMGDAVNLGSRLEGINKNYRTNILISESTYERVKDEFVCMEVDRVRVKGKTLPVNIYQLLAYNQLPETRGQAISLFHQGLELYRRQKWDEAIRVFQGVVDIDKGVGVAEVYIQRSRDLKANPPSPNWDGVFIMTTK